MNLLLPTLVVLAASLMDPIGLGLLPSPEPKRQEPAPTAEQQAVVLKVKIGDEIREFGPVPVTGKITVEKLMRDLVQQDDSFEFQAQGKGETFFVTSVLGKANEGRGGRNWIFKIDDRLANRGAGTLEIEAPAVVTWEFHARESRSP